MKYLVVRYSLVRHRYKGMRHLHALFKGLPGLPGRAFLAVLRYVLLVHGSSPEDHMMDGGGLRKAKALWYIL